ncbi:hypothetical protein [Nonomuraea roseoviolacea]|uniref:Uncharacterized protein n=1 Tax=Nonomuraea roseoviolacea subsp. carminata TaxID=160689 RepID=A0ABT1KAW3_9ACTN|nr:hypothetical protein [Nonomuraea roseoviolacea]MCP2351143.1 hypothetical protein [Nonomuraea roseoviolacea subsp. carminata]
MSAAVVVTLDYGMTDDRFQFLSDHRRDEAPGTAAGIRTGAQGGGRGSLPEASWHKVDEVLDAGLWALERAHRAGVRLAFLTAARKGRVSFQRRGEGTRLLPTAALRDASSGGGV